MVRLGSQPHPFWITILVLIALHDAGHAKQFRAPTWNPACSATNTQRFFIKDQGCPQLFVRLGRGDTMAVFAGGPPQPGSGGCRGCPLKGAGCAPDTMAVFAIGRASGGVRGVVPPGYNCV